MEWVKIIGFSGSCGRGFARRVKNKVNKAVDSGFWLCIIVELSGASAPCSLKVRSK